MSLLLSSSPPLLSPLSSAPLCAATERSVCWVRSLPDTRLRDLTFTDRKSRKRERERAREGERERERAS